MKNLRSATKQKQTPDKESPAQRQRFIHKNPPLHKEIPYASSGAGPFRTEQCGTLEAMALAILHMNPYFLAAG